MTNENFTSRDGDTVKLLRECDAGVKMGISSIEDVIGDVKNSGLRKILTDSRQDHQKLADRLESLLDDHHDDGKNPNPMAKGMSWIKTNVMMMADNSDETIADLMTDGCNMGVKSLNKYLNRYQSADNASRDIAKNIINVENQLSKDIAEFL